MTPTPRGGDAAPSSPPNAGGAEGTARSKTGVSAAAIAAVETSSIAQGIVAADAMVKRAEVELLQVSVLSPGRYAPSIWAPTHKTNGWSSVWFGARATRPYVRRSAARALRRYKRGPEPHG